MTCSFAFDVTDDILFYLPNQAVCRNLEEENQMKLPTYCEFSDEYKAKKVLKENNFHAPRHLFNISFSASFLVKNI